MLEPRYIKRRDEIPENYKPDAAPDAPPLVLLCRSFPEGDWCREEQEFLRVIWDGTSWVIWERIYPYDIVAVSPDDAPVRPAFRPCDGLEPEPIRLGRPGRYAFTFYMYIPAEEK
jgi:hypothetical protein